MDRKLLTERLKELRDVILAERKAARELAIDKMVELTALKEKLLDQTSRMLDSVDRLTPAEKKLSEDVYSENLRNAYFFWSALNWVRQSMGFFGDRMYPESYGGNGSKVKCKYSGALLSGKV